MVIKGLNYKIVTTDNGDFKIDALIKLNGKQYRTRETFKGGRREAERRAQKLVQVLSEKAQNENSLPTAPRSLKTFGECITFYLENTTTNTASTKPHMGVVQEHLSDVPMDDDSVFQHRYDLFVSQMRKTTTLRKTFYSTTTINRFTKRIITVMNFCKRKRKLSRDFQFEPSLFKEKPRKRDMSEDEILRLFTAVKEYRPYLLPIIQYALLIPSRKSELVQMRRNWVSLESKSITIPDEYTKPDIECVKPIPPSMIEYFKSIPVESEFVFCRYEDGEYLPLGDFKKAWHYCLTKAGISNLRFHDTRHYAASNLVKLGISEREIMQVAGWQTNMLSTYYGNKALSASTVVFEALQALV